MAPAWKAYEGEQGRALAETYEALDPDSLHVRLRDSLPKPPAAILDIGAGSGRDAAWLAGLGYEVAAVEPSSTMRSEAQERHRDARITWVEDHLPVLDRVMRLGLSFDVILLSAVWMHVAPADRARAFRKMVTLLKPGGMIALTLRQGPAPADRPMHAVSAEEIATLAKAHGVVMVSDEESPDQGGRPEVSWHYLLLRLPDDGTGALPLLRHVILNDAKSSTYKLGLLRAVSRAASGSAGLVRPDGGGAMLVPLGLIALNWLRLYVPLVRAGLPQTPTNTGAEGLGFAKKGWAGISHLAPSDLRLGGSQTGQAAQSLHAALRDAAATIARMPATYLCYPGTAEPVLPVTRQRTGQCPERLLIDGAYLWSFGHLSVPLHLWRALSRFDAWIEPALISEWQLLMETYASRQGRLLDPGTVVRAMRWHDPTRATGQVRQIALPFAEDGALHCVWSGRRLNSDRLDIDHALPWSAWPCNDLWNLLPADRAINQRHKRDRLPSAMLLERCRDRIQDWWSRGYVALDPAMDARFRTEVAGSLPMVSSERSGLDAVFSGLQFRRSAIRADTQVAEWEG